MVSIRGSHSYFQRNLKVPRASLNARHCQQYFSFHGLTLKCGIALHAVSLSRINLRLSDSQTHPLRSYYSIGSCYTRLSSESDRCHLLELSCACLQKIITAGFVDFSCPFIEGGEGGRVSDHHLSIQRFLPTLYGQLGPRYM